MNSLSKNLYLIKRFGNSLFTYDCISCGKPVQGKCLCESCREKLNPSGNYYNGFACAYYYKGPAKETMLCYKFKPNNAFCFDTICDWLLSAFEKLGTKDFDAVVPVPSFERNETRLSKLCEKFALMSDLPFRPELIRKIHKTEKQRKLSAKERRLNIAGAFEAEDSVFGKKILLVDDIFTTGSTVNECANALYDKGAEKVFIITVLKTVYEKEKPLVS